MADISKLEEQEQRIHKKIAELWAKKLKEECPEFTSLEDVFNSLSIAKNMAQAEIERLLQILQQAKSEAIREFAERLKEKTKRDIELYGRCTGYGALENIDNLVKEMTEVQK